MPDIAFYVRNDNNGAVFLCVFFVFLPPLLHYMLALLLSLFSYQLRKV